MKKLKRRLSHAFRSSYKSDDDGAHISGQQLVDSFHSIDLNGASMIQPNYNRSNFGSYHRKGHGSQGSLDFSDSFNHISERLTADGIIIEEGHIASNGVNGVYRRRGSRNQLYPPQSNFVPDRPIISRPVSYYGHVSSVCEYPNCEPQVLIRPKSRRTCDVKSKHKSFTEHLVGSLKKTGRPLFGHRNKAVVHETNALGSDGESIEVSPCTSDQMSTSSHGHSSCGNNIGGESNHHQRYIPNVKLRSKPNNRRWSEQDIQKRLSLPADIKLPQNVVEKLNRTPTLDNPLTRKSRRASLSEIGFGKLETYKKMFDLGEGTYATVYLGESLLTGKLVALKEIRLEHEEGAPCTAIREVSLLRNLKHANVVTLHDIIYTDRILTLVFEYVERDLRDYMEEVDTMININNVKLFLMQLLRGLAYCHKRRVLHRDLKPQNLLINNNGELKLADFGLARAQSVPTKTYSNEVVTLWYRPPDVLLGSKEYSSHIDMWGVGCILYEMLTRKAMFPGSTTDEQLNLIFSTLGPPTHEKAASLLESPNFKQLNFRPSSKPKPLTKLSPRIDNQSSDLLDKFLKYEGRERISAADAMHHQFLSNFPSAIFSLADNESILTVPGVRYIQENLVHSRNLPMVHSSTSMNGFTNQSKQTFQKHT